MPADPESTTTEAETVEDESGRNTNGRMRSLLTREHRLRRLIADEWSEPISRAGLLMMANTVVTGALGLLYWTLAARLYSQSAVGRASALVSLATLLATVGQLNLGGTLVRFLDQARERSRQLVIIVYAVACGSAVVLTIVVEIALDISSKHGSQLHLSLAEHFVFTACVLATVIFALQDQVLIGVRRIGWLAIENGGFGVAKLIMVVVLASAGGWGAIFASWMLPLAATLPIIGWLLFGRMLPKSAPRGQRKPVRDETKRRIRRFAFGDAVAGVFAQSWSYALPPIVAATLGSQANARFYAALLFVSFLDLVGTNYATPLVVEASRDRAALPKLVISTARRIYILLIPAALLFVLAGRQVLHIYGASYASAGTALALLALACLPRAILTLYYAVCNVHQRTHQTAIIQGTHLVLVVAGALIFAHDGITTVALVVLVVSTGCAAAITPSFLRAARAVHA